MSSDETAWENRYLLSRPEDLPWNAQRPDPDLVRWVEAGLIPRGQALDVGTGPGHDAVFLLQKAFDVIGVDISRSAIQLARENASHHGLFGYFQVADIRHLPIEDAYVDFANDRGCLHVLRGADQIQAVSEIHRVLVSKGLFLLRTHSDKGSGPHAMSRGDVEGLVAPFFQTLEFHESVFAGPASFPSYLLLLRKK